MLYNPKYIQSGFVVMVNEIRVTRMRDTRTVPAFSPTGDRRAVIDRWSVAETPLPQGATPSDVAAHYAALSPFGAGESILLDALDAATLWDAIRGARTAEGGRVWTDADPYGCRIFAVRTEKDAHALVVDQGVPALMPARKDEAQAARLAADFAAEQGHCPGADEAAAAYLECVARALKDPAVMMPLFDASNPSPFDAIRRAFMERPYVLDAVKKIGGLV
jgi:hypothetical protein